MVAALARARLISSTCRASSRAPMLVGVPVRQDVLVVVVAVVAPAPGVERDVRVAVSMMQLAQIW